MNPLAGLTDEQILEIGTFIQENRMGEAIAKVHQILPDLPHDGKGIIVLKEIKHLLGLN